MTTGSFPQVAIAGYGAICAVGRGVEALTSALRANASGLRGCDRFAHPRYQSSIVGAVGGNGTGGDHDDPAYELAKEALDEACDRAKDLLRSTAAERIGLVLSTTKAN